MVESQSMSETLFLYLIKWRIAILTTFFIVLKSVQCPDKIGLHFCKSIWKLVSNVNIMKIISLLYRQFLDSLLNVLKIMKKHYWKFYIGKGILGNPWNGFSMWCVCRCQSPNMVEIIPYKRYCHGNITPSLISEVHWSLPIYFYQNQTD